MILNSTNWDLKGAHEERCVGFGRQEAVATPLQASTFPKRIIAPNTSPPVHHRTTLTDLFTMCNKVSSIRRFLLRRRLLYVGITAGFYLTKNDILDWSQ